MKNNLILFITLLTFIACNNDKKEQETLKADVIAVHDEVMPKMGDLDRLARQLNNLADSLEVDSTQATLINMLRIKSSELKSANESMMVWMRQYDAEYASKAESHEEVMGYLKDQMIKITKVKEEMNGSLQTGKDLFENSKIN